MDKILLIDEDENLLVETSTILKEGGFEVHYASDVAEGLLLANKVYPDLVILDRDLAERNNFELLGTLRKAPSTLASRILISSYSTTNEYVETGEYHEKEPDEINYKSIKSVSLAKAREYSEAVSAVWADKILSSEEGFFLDKKVKTLGLSEEESLWLEEQVMGFNRKNTPSLAKGADAYLIKPYGIETVLLVVNAQFEKIQSFRELEATTKRLTEILEGSIDIIAILDAEMEKILYLNEAGRAFLGEELLGAPVDSKINFEGANIPVRSLLDRYSKMGRKILSNAGLPIALRKGSWNGETIVLNEAGEETPISQLIQVHKSQKGAVEFISFIIRDITDIKNTAKELHRQEGLYRLISDNATDLIAVIDFDKKFIYSSPSYLVTLGFSMEDLRGTDFMDKVHSDDRKLVMDAIDTATSTGNGVLIECSLLKKDGTYRSVEFQRGVIRNDVGEIESILAVARDITLKKKVEKERDFMEIQLRHAQKLESIGQLAAGVAHEINTPVQYVGDNLRFMEDYFADIKRILTKYNRMLEFAKSEKLTSEIIQDMDKTIANSDISFLLEEIPLAIQQSLEGVRCVTKIVRSMKEFSHPGNQGKTPVELNKIIKSTITISRNEWKYVCDIKTDLDPDLPLISCFPDEFNQAMLNLILNAAHAIGDIVEQDSSKRGVINISTRIEGPDVVVKISDTGGGIPDEIKDRVFDPFFTTKEVGKGTGQGLAIAHSVITEKHGGTIAFESEAGKGTTFILKIPVEPTLEIA